MIQLVLDFIIQFIFGSTSSLVSLEASITGTGGTSANRFASTSAIPASTDDYALGVDSGSAAGEAQH